LRAEQRESAVWQAASAAGLAWLDEVRGRLGQAARDLDAFMAVSEQRGVASSYVVGAIRRGLLDLRYRHRPLAALSAVEAALGRHPLTSIPTLNRPYSALAAFYAEAGRPEAARRLLAEYERLVPERTRRGHPGQLAAAYERARHPDSALAVYERSVTAGGVRAPLVLFDPVDARAFAATLQRLGTLYAARSDHAKARDYYGRFVDLWKDADPELQPLVADARAALKRLR